jgi:hypothetical protein
MDERARNDRGTIDRPAGTVEDVDLSAVLRGVADRIDAVFAAGAPAAGRRGRADQAHDEDAVAAWSSVVGTGTTSGDERARRAALATTVLRIGADGSLDVVGDRQAREDRELLGPSDVPRADEDDDRADEERRLAPDASLATTSHVEGRQDVETRLRDARDRMARRRAEATVEARAASAPIWRRVDGRKLVQRVLVAAAIVAVSALVSLLAT